MKRHCSRTFEAVATTALSLISRGCKWSQAEAQVLAEALPHFQLLKELNLGNNELDAEAVGQLAEVLPLLQHLEELYLYGNQIGAAGLDRLAAALPQCPALKTLYLGKTGTAATDVQRMREQFPCIGIKDVRGFDLRT